MELRTLRYFLATCQEGSMSKAAEKLHVTQPTLSRQIADLERELGAELLVRRSRSVEPTEAGLFLQKRAADIVGLADKTSEDFAARSGELEGSISIVANDPAGMASIGPCIRGYRQKRPKVRFHFHNTDNERTLDRLANGVDDFAIVIGHVPAKGFESVRLAPVGPMGVFMPEGDVLASRKRITCEDLEDKPLIVPQRAFTLDRDVFTEWFGNPPDSYNIQGTYTHGRTGTMLVNGQMGYMIGTQDMAPSGTGTGFEFRPLAPPVLLPVDFVWRRDGLGAPAAREFKDFVTSSPA